MKGPTSNSAHPYQNEWYNVIPQIIVLSSMEFACIVFVYACFLILFGSSTMWRGLGGFLITLQLFCVSLPMSTTPSSLCRQLGFFCSVVGRDYYPVSTTFIGPSSTFVPNQAYLFAYEPHSVLPVGIVAFSPHSPSPLLKRFPWMRNDKIRILASSAIFMVPITGHILRWMGVYPIDRSSFKQALEAGVSVCCCPGGMTECITPHEKDEEVALVKSRYGFVKLAIEAGTPIVPVFAFGQSRSFNSYCPRWIPGYKSFCKLIRFAPIIFWGRWLTPMPINFPIRVVVGQPIVFTKTLNPSNELVEKVHECYVKELIKLHEENKGKVEGELTKLKIA